MGSSRNTAAQLGSRTTTGFVVRIPPADLCCGRPLYDYGFVDTAELVGIDYLSIERFDAPGHPVHHRLLESDVTIVEGLDLSQVPAGTYQFICLPLRLAGVDGAPARAVLIG